jgi:hypothetical protein
VTVVLSLAVPLNSGVLLLERSATEDAFRTTVGDLVLMVNAT